MFKGDEVMVSKRITRAFTLIELLVVIAIIAILAAILFPVFAQAREAARTSGCSSNEKQIALGVLMYLQDYDEKMPSWEYDLSAGDPNIGKVDPSGGVYQEYHKGWDEVVQPYIKNKQILWCPSANGPGNDYNDKTKHDDGWTGSMNYATNCEMTGRGWDQWQNPSKLAAVNYPATTILIVEAGTQTSEGACMGLRGDEWGWMNDHKQNLYYEGATGNLPAPLRRHKEGANYAFVDGHVKFYNGGQLGWQSGGTGNKGYPGDAVMDAKMEKLMPRTPNGSGPNYWPF